VVDVKPLLAKPVFQPLKDKVLFEKVHIIYDYTIAWNVGNCNKIQSLKRIELKIIIIVLTVYLCFLDFSKLRRTYSRCINKAQTKIHKRI
jgi:hypothetical protein